MASRGKSQLSVRQDARRALAQGCRVHHGVDPLTRLVLLVVGSGLGYELNLLAL